MNIESAKNKQRGLLVGSVAQGVRAMLFVVVNTSNNDKEWSKSLGIDAKNTT